MQNTSPDRATRIASQPTTNRPSAPTATPRRAIDCGASTDDRIARPRADRGDVRHAWTTTRGTYADQAQAI